MGIQIGDLVSLIVSDQANKEKMAMYHGFKARVQEIQGDKAYITTGGITQAVSFKTWWPLCDLKPHTKA